MAFKTQLELRYAIYLEHFNRTFFTHQVSFWKHLNKLKEQIRVSFTLEALTPVAPKKSDMVSSMCFMGYCFSMTYHLSLSDGYCLIISSDAL